MTVMLSMPRSIFITVFIMHHHHHHHHLESSFLDHFGYLIFNWLGKAWSEFVKFFL